MAKQLNSYEVKLDFKADTSQAKKEIQSLQDQLSSAINKSAQGNFGPQMSKEISSAISSATKLKTQLQEAFNVDTGRLDLGKFKQSMDQSGMSLKKYQQQLTMLGPEGEQAFRQLASSVVQAEIPLKRSNALVKEFATTLANTARWQISSSLLHGIMGAIQGAYGYAQDLNESLNNIRIVTGYSNDQMAKFAANANKAAQALSTTTTAYTDAALIYYQQGLGDEEVLGRSDVTVKMANVSRQSAEEVSDQLTAIWNNFYDGSKSLEYYADVITALGAATASSSEEISTGLEKFAAVANTVGLSYEYATAALATITATTRQSADTVGTGLRTLFARLEGLKLGDTLEDGVDLNKYSQALDTVGVKLFDVNGEIKNMDTILDETAEKWDTLSKAQQIAFAQTVGGVRQYTNLIALMDNWDFMQSNLGVAGDATGTLQKQADIYAESWEAAQKKVKAAAEEIYGALLNDKFFIDLNQMLADTLHGFATLIKGMGGVKGVLVALGAVFTTVFRDNIVKSIDDTIYGLKMMTKAGREALAEEKNKANAMLLDSYKGSDIVSTSMQSAVGQQYNLQAEYLKYSEKMTAAEREQASVLLQQQQTLIQNIKLRAEEVQELEKANNLEKIKIKNQFSNSGQNKIYKDTFEQILKNSASTGIADNFIKELENLNISEQATEKDIENLQKLMASAGPEIKQHFINAFGAEGGDAITNLNLHLKDGRGNLQEYLSNIIALTRATNPWQEQITSLVEILQEENVITEEVANKMIKLAESQYQAGVRAGELQQRQSGLINFTNQVGKSFADLIAKNTTLTQSLVAMAGTMMNVASSIRMFTGLIEVWKDDSVSTGQKILQTITILSSAIMMLSKVQWKETAAHIANIGAKITSIFKSNEHTAATIAETIATEGLTAATLGYIAVALIVVALLAGLAYGIYKLVTAEERQAKQLKDTKEKAEELTEQYKELKNSAEEFRNTISDYQDGLNELNTLKDSQEELNKAIEESNKKAKELIETYKLFDDYTIDANGAIIINQEALDSVQKQKDLQAANARATAAGAQINAFNQERNFALDNIKYDNYYNRFDDNQKQLLANEFKNYSEKNAGVVNTEGFIKYIEKDTEFINTFGNRINDVSQLLTNLNNLGIDSLKNYLNVVNETAEGMRHWTRELYSADFQAQNYEQLHTLATVNGEFSQARYELISAVAGIKQDAIELADTSSVTDRASLSNWISEGHTDIATELFGDAWGKAISGKDLIANYAALHSGGNASDYDIVKNSDGQYTAKNIYTQEDAVSNLSEDAVSKLMAAELAVKEAMKDTGYDFLPSLTDIIQKADEAGSQYGVDFSNALLSSLIEGEGTLKDFNLSSIFGELTEEEWNELKALSPEELANLFGITEQNLEALGLKSKEELHDKFQEGLGDKYDATDNTATQNAIGEETAEKVGLNVDAFKLYREELKNTYPELAKNAKAANDVAIANMRLAKGVNSIIDNWDEYNEVLSNANAQSEDVANVTADMKEALSDMLNIDASTFELLPPDFAQKNWQLITDAVNGVEGKVDELRDKAGEEILLNVAADDTELQNKLLELHNYLAEANNENFEINVPISLEGNEAFYENCQKIIDAAGFTAEEAQKYFASMGYDVEFYDAEKPGETRTQTQKVHWFNSITNEWEDGTGEITEFTPAAKGTALKTITPNGNYGGNVAVKKTGVGGGGKKSGGGGGGGKTAVAENQKITSKDDAGIKRYKEIDDALQDIAEDQERINKLTDTYYGANKVKAMKQRAEMLKQEADLHKKKYEWAKKYQDEDLANLQGFAADHGMNLDFQQEYDAVTGKTRSGSLTNYTAIMENLYSQLNEKETYWAKASNFGSKEAQDEYKKKYIDPIAETIKEFDKLVGIYDDSRKTLDEEANDYLDRIIEAQEATYAAYKEDWDLKLEILEDQRKFLDHSKKLLGDSAVELGEAMALIGTKEGEGYLANTLGNITELARQEKELESIREEIGEDNYYNRLKEIRDGYLENTEALKELDDEMMEYYGKVMDKVNQEVEKYIKNMETLKKTLQSYQKVLKVTGRENDYDAMDDLLRGEASVIQAQYDTKAEQYELYQREVAKAEAALKEAEKSHDEKAIEIQKKRLETAKTNLQEVGNEMLDILAEKAENAKAIMDNMRAKIMASYEDAMTNDLGFDYLDATMERYSTIQDLYLTKTNQVFETTKMLRKIQTDMDSTSNRAAKQRLNNFAKEIESLKARDKMTKADLELAQKRYDLLLAQIALEEAQKAKTTVRLQRDNEGNYGYVYTADEGDIAKAQDDMLNAENDLYNTRLRIANESGEAIYQINEEWMNAINELVEEYENDRNMSEEEFNKKKEEINKYYLGLMAVHSHNFTEAQKEDARVVADAWINNHDHDLPTVMEVTEKFGEVSTKTLDRVDIALDEFKQVIDDVVDEQEDRFGDSVDITHDVETATKDLAKEIRDDLRHEYKQLFDRVGNMIDQYSKERNYILNSVIPAYTNQAKAIQEVIDKRRELATVQDQPQQKYDGTGGGNGSATVGAGTGNGGSGGGGGGGNPPAGGSPTYSGNNKQGGKGLDFANEQAEAADSSSWKEDLLTTSRLNTFGMNKLGYKEGSKLLTVFVNAYKGKKKKDLVSSYPAYEKYIANLATGGYTGEWNDGSGKLAVLHSKELVLNAQDTENMLAVVDMVRQVVNSIDMNAASLAGGYGALSSGGSGTAGPQTLEQNVQITASFPNATNHSEIEEAFNNLINKASQYANRR